MLIKGGMANEALFKLLRIAIGSEPACQLSATVDWRSVIDMSIAQNVAAIAADGLQKVYDLFPDSSIELDNYEFEDIKYGWLWHVTEEENRNKHQRAVLKGLADLWSSVGVKTMLLKGQANSLYYPEPFHRAVGDIDVFLSDYDLGNQVAKDAGAKVDTGWYKHSQIRWKGEMFENHRHFVHTRDGARGKKLDNTLIELLDGAEYEHFPGSEILLPPVMFNALFLTYHSLAHFLSEGIRLKQIMDWAMFLKKEQKRIDWQKFYAMCEEFHFRRWVDAMNDIAVHQFGIEVVIPCVVCVSPYSEKIIHSAIHNKDYVFSSGKGSWANRLHLITNMFKYSWKYHQIYQESILRQLWYYASGYLFKTE